MINKNKEECFSRAGEMQAAKQYCNASPTRDHNTWAADRYKRYGRYSGRGNLFESTDRY